MKSISKIFALLICFCLFNLTNGEEPNCNCAKNQVINNNGLKSPKACYAKRELADLYCGSESCNPGTHLCVSYGSCESPCVVADYTSPD
jgi:hypothetical protein